MKISIVIPTHKKWDILKHTLKSFQDCDFDKKEYEIIVCINGDNSCQSSYFDELPLEYPLTVLREPIANRSIARNACIHAAKGDIILFSDDDTLVSKSFLSDHYKRQELSTGAVIGIRLQVRYKIPPLVYSMNDINQKAYSGIYFKQIIARILQNGRSKNWVCSITGNMSVPRAVLMKVGCFDKSFTGWGFEDVELGYRLSEYGLDFIYAPEALNYHVEHKRSRSNMITEMYRNIQYFYDKYNRDSSIFNFWEFYCGRISLEEFDKRVFEESVNWMEKEQVIFQLFKSSNLPSLNQ